MGRVTACCAALALWVCVAGSAQAADYAWIEGERPDRANYQVGPSAWGNQQYLSGEAWLNLGVPAEEVESKLPEGGIVLGYDFALDTPGRYEVWNRIGYEFARSTFEWRLDDGAWNEVTTDDLTTDLMEIARWNEVAWLRMGEAQLGAGAHSIEIRHALRYADENGARKPQRVLYASDALCVCLGEFRPNGKQRPDADWQTPEDRAAAAHVFGITTDAPPGERAVTALNGPWQIARFDEQEIADRLGPIAALPDPERLYWSAVGVPGDRDAARPDLVFCHRYLYRTRFRVPAEAAGRSFVLRFPSTNMVATVFVNGEMCGWNKTPLTAWQCDVTRAVRPGEVNDLWVGIKDTYYAIAEGTRGSFNLPTDMMGTQAASMRFDMPVWNAMENGIIEAPEMIVTGPAYVAEVLTRPSVTKGELGLEVTLANPTGAGASMTVHNVVLPLGGETPELEFHPASGEVPAGGRMRILLGEQWHDAKLWWPDSPKQYEVVTTVTVGGQVADTVRTKFGFREWGWDGTMFTLNGVPWQLRADTDMPGRTPEEQVAEWKHRGQTMMRLWRHGYGDNATREYLDAMDRLGMPVRRSGIFDGEGAAYGLVEDVDGRRQAKEALFDNWREQVLAWVRAEYNHPSIFVWSIENEIMYINSINFGTTNETTPAIRSVAEAVMVLDPTRPAMIDGGRALPDFSLPINGCHYNDPVWRELPDATYSMDYLRNGEFHEPWPLRDGAPVFLGEAFFANGNTPAAFAQVMGEAAFLGRAEARPGVSLIARMSSEGYRWQGLAAFHYWFGGETGDGSHYVAWQPVCVLCRQWDWTFGAGSQVSRTLKVFNDTRYDDPITMAWQFVVAGQRVAGSEAVFEVAPGGAVETEMGFAVPEVAERTSADFILTCSRRGEEVFRDVKEAWIIPTGGAPVPQVAEGEIAVWDAGGAVKERLRARGLPFVEFTGLDALPDGARVIVVGPDALTGRDATDPRWRDLAAAGKRILLLDQEQPLHYQAVPADLDVSGFDGRIAFSENLAHPAFEGLGQPDFFAWPDDHVVYRNAYVKATSGAKSLVQCDEDLGYSALSEVTAGDGLMLLCQLAVGSKLARAPVAQRLFDNMLNYCLAYEPVRKSSVACARPGDQLDELLTEIGLVHDLTDDVAGAVSDGKHSIVLALADPETLRALAGSRDAVRRFAAGGGWLVLTGLGPDGLGDFTRLVGFEQMIRPFETERVTLPAQRDPLMAGLTARDVVMESGQRIYGWAADQFMAGDVFTYILDYDDIAPFCQFPGPEYWNDPGVGPGNDTWPRNMVNGFVTSDSWRYAFSIHLNNNDPTEWTVKLPRRETITGFSIVPNAIYRHITKMRLVFDGDESGAVELDLKPVGERQDFTFDPRSAEELTVDITEWDDARGNVIGVDNLWVWVERSDEFRRGVVPLLNIGGLVKYPIGRGGIVLNQLRMFGQESVPINAAKKRNILATILRNMGAVFSGGAEGGAVEYRTVPLGDKCNRFLAGEDAWFGGGRDMRQFPLGEQRFAGVPLDVRYFRTSPLPSCIILNGRQRIEGLPWQVEGIPVGGRADGLRFLHTLNQYDRPGRWEDQQAVAFRYVVHYADGGTEEVPVRLGVDVAHWLQRDPEGLRNAALAWAAPLPGEQSGEQAAVYMMAWENPRPDVEIASVDVAYGEPGDRFGMPAVLAITAVTRR